LPTFFRFTIQTTVRRYAEVWSFFCNDNEGCLYATRTSMKTWSKFSFHHTGACHTKTRQKEIDETGAEVARWRKQFEWQANLPTLDHPVHLLRILYPIEGQRARLPVETRVPITFEEWGGRGRLYLDVFTVLSETPIEADEDKGIAAAHRLKGPKWVYFVIGADAETVTLPASVMGMSLHMGEYVHDNANNLIGLKNATGIWYDVPKATEPVVVIERSWELMAAPRQEEGAG